MKYVVGIMGWAITAAGAGQTPSPLPQPVPPVVTEGPQPIGSLAQYFGVDSYPVEALRQHEQGRVVAQLRIDTDGKVVGCTVTMSSGSTTLDQQTCNLALTRMIFTPAKDGQGHSVASNYRLPIRWVLPAGTPAGPGPLMPAFMPVKSFAAVVEQVVDANGKRLSCSARIDGQPLADPRACTAAMGDVAAAIRLLPAAMRGHPFVLFSESRQEYAGLPKPPVQQEVGAITLGRIITHFTISAAGKATDCKITGAPRREEVLANSPCLQTLPFGVLPGTPAVLPLAAIWTESFSARPLPEGDGT